MPGVGMAHIAQTAFFEIPVRWFELPMNPHRYSFAPPIDKGTSVSPAARDSEEQDRVSSDEQSQVQPEVVDRDGPGKLLNALA
jgi:hypothetical protein